MVNPAIIASIAAANASMAASRRMAEASRRQQEEARRRRAAEERRRREEEQRRQRNEEDRRRRERERKNKQVKDYHQKQKEHKGLYEEPLSMIHKFTDELKIKHDSLDIVYEGTYKKILADGSVLSDLDGKYVRTHPDGRIQEYESQGSWENKYLILTREELPNGAMVVYDGGKKVYQRDEQGNYTYHKYNEDGKLREVLEGNADTIEPKEFSNKLKVKFTDLNIVHEGAFERVLADGSRLSNVDYKYIMTHPNGRIQEYESQGSWENKYLILTREELPNGAMVIYDEGKKIYQRDEQGNYTYHKTDRYGEITETLEGKTFAQEPEGFTDKLELGLNSFDAVYKGTFDKFLPNGAVVSEQRDKCEVRYPSGRVQEYKYSWNTGSGSKYVLTREELPNGAMVVYDEGKKIYEKDEQGNYTYHKTNSNGEIIETVKGRIDTNEPTEFSNRLDLDYDSLEIVSKGASGNILVDGSRVSDGNNYEVRHHNGRVQEYKYVWESGASKSILLREELPNGAMVIYNEAREKNYERDKDGNYTYYEYDNNSKLKSILKGDKDMWKKTVYNDEGGVSYYITSDEPNKKYYPSGKLFEEIKEDGSCFMYAENGICLYEDNKEEYKKYQLNADGTDRLLIEKGKDNAWSEKYVYYPSGKLKEEYTGGRWSGNIRKFNENGVCLYEATKGGSYYSEYQLAPNGKDRLLVKKVKYDTVLEHHLYNSNGKIKESKYADGSYIVYEEDGTYKKFDKHARLKEETDVLGKTTYTHYEGVNMVEHVTRYDVNGNRVESEYKHFDKKGKEDTAYYLAMKRIVARKIEKADKKQAKEGVPVAERKVSRKMSKAAKLFAHLKAKRESRKA